MQMVLIIQIRYYYNEHASRVMCVCAFFSLSCNFIIVVCQPLGSKAFYFTYANECALVQFIQ